MKFALTFPIADLRGKTSRGGPLVATYNRGINFFRPNKKPMDRKTADQTTLRAWVSDLANKYKEMTIEQQVAWSHLVRDFPISNYGKNIILSPFNLFMRVNISRYMAGHLCSYVAPRVRCDFTCGPVQSLNWDMAENKHAAWFTTTYSGPLFGYVFIKVSNVPCSVINVYPKQLMRYAAGLNSDSVKITEGGGETYYFTNPGFDLTLGNYYWFQLTPLSSDFLPGLSSTSIVQYTEE